jgi:hypothetical protein
MELSNAVGPIAPDPSQIWRDYAGSAGRLSATASSKHFGSTRFRAVWGEACAASLRRYHKEMVTEKIGDRDAVRWYVLSCADTI